jgi:glycosyltransferase involved in cell wall biosynthesis
MNMRVGFDARWYNGSGVGTYVAELTKEFSQCQDCELVVFSDPCNPVPSLDGRSACIVDVRSARFSLASQFELRALCRKYEIDVFHTPYQYGAPLFLPCPLVITVHDLIPFLFRTRSWPKQLTAVPCVKTGYHLASRRATQIIADSANTARDVQRILKVSSQKVTAVHLAASAASFHPRQRPSEAEYLMARYGVRPPFAIVGSAGNWRAKNLETALQALQLAARISGIAFQTVVYGPPQGLAACRNGSSALNVIRVGYVPTEHLAALFRNAHLFITASLYEGFGLPILEAMSCGCPVVTSNGGSLAEVAGNGALVFAPMDEAGMAQAVAILLRDPDARRFWRARALTRARDFSWRKTAEQTVAVYRKLLDCNNGPRSPVAYHYDNQSAHSQKSA